MRPPSQAAFARRRSLALVITLLALLLSGCGGMPVVSSSDHPVDVDMLMAGEPVLRGSMMPGMPEADLLAMTPEMEAFVNYYVNPESSLASRLLQLESAIIHNPNFRLDYASHTFTAADTFRYGYGNCVSFTNLFVAMARYVGLSAHYQEVEIPPSWDREGGMMILNRHINVVIRNKVGGHSAQAFEHVVDFNNSEVKDTYTRRSISDRRASALYYSNIGVYYLQRDQYRNAFAFMRKGLLTDPEFHDLWINLGALYSRVGELRYAERAYLEAIRHDRSMIGFSNLARVYEQLGNEVLAAQYRQEVARYRANNPYYRYHLAQQAMERGAFLDAIKQLEAAVRLKPVEDEFHFLLGVAHLRAGDLQKAVAQWDAMRAVISDPALHGRYDHKINQLIENLNQSSIAG